MGYIWSRPVLKFFLLVLLAVSIGSKKGQSPCESSNLIWYTVNYTVATNSIIIAEGNIDFTIPTFTGNSQISMLNLGCFNENEYYCGLAYLVSDVDPITNRPKLGKHPVCVIRRSNN